LGSADLSALTPKLVRAHLSRTLGVSEQIMDGQLKKEVRRITAEEMEKINGGAEAASAAAAPSPAPSPSKGKKNKAAAEAEESPSKRQKKADGSAAKKSNGTAAASESAAMEDGAGAAEAGGADGAEEDAAAEEETQEDADARMAAELAAGDRRPRRAAAAASSKAVRKSAPRERKAADPNAAPKKPAPLAALSPQLSEFLGDGITELSRGEVTKRIWNHIRENQLQDPADKRKIVLDDKLKGIFGDKTKVSGTMHVAATAVALAVLQLTLARCLSLLFRQFTFSSCRSSLPST
jgi:chromatin remodeling complex protein RSC6